MYRRNALNIFLGAGIILSLIYFLYLCRTQLEPNSHRLAVTLEIMCIAGIGLTLKRLFDLLLIMPFPQQKIPPVVLHIIDFFLIAGTFLTISVFVFKRDISHVLTAGSIISASLAFALKTVILDAFSGFILDSDHHFHIGDWISSKGHKMVGKVVKINWRTTVVKSENGCLYYVPNGELVRKGYTYYPAFYNDTIEVLVHQSVPHERVRRVLRGALLTLSQINDHKCSVYARNFNGDQILYEIRYAVQDYAKRNAIRNLVFKKLSPSLMLYTLRQEPKEPHQVIPDLLKYVDLFQSLTPEEVQSLSEAVQIEKYHRGQIIVQQGENKTSMYVIAEGAAEVLLEQAESTNSVSLAFLGMGQFFGDIALLTGRPRTATVRAVTDMVVCRIDKEHFQPLLLNNSTLAKKLSDVITFRLASEEKAFHPMPLPEKITSAHQFLKEIISFFGL